MAQDPSEVRQAIDQDRIDLANTVQALVYKADVKQRARESMAKNADEIQHRARRVISSLRQVTPDQVQSGLGSAADSVRRQPFPFAIAAAFVVGLLIGRVRGQGGTRTC